MKRNSYTRGMTFFEVLVVMGIFVLVGGFVLFVSMETYRGSSFRSDRDLLVAALQHARAQAMNNICFGACTDGKPHGVFIDNANNKYVIFQGGYIEGAPENAVFDGNPTTARSGLSQVIFTQLSATTSTTGDIVLTNQAGHISTTTISSEGQITWTN